MNHYGGVRLVIYPNVYEKGRKRSGSVEISLTLWADPCEAIRRIAPYIPKSAVWLCHPPRSTTQGESDGNAPKAAEGHAPTEGGPACLDDCELEPAAT